MAHTRLTKGIPTSKIPAMYITMADNGEVGSTTSAIGKKEMRAAPPPTATAIAAKQYFQDMYVRITPEQIDELEVLVDQAWPNTTKASEFKAMAEKGKRVAVGTKYSDIELVNPDGKKVKLSEYVPEGKYVMLEFWASWCGPCRGEIPHLREVYKEYKDKGFEIVSISIDRKDQDWKKAMKEENMVWTQLNDPGEFEGPVTQVYNIMGVPTCILLDKEGHIFKTDMRGAQLDAVLEEIYD